MFGRTLLHYKTDEMSVADDLSEPAGDTGAVPFPPASEPAGDAAAEGDTSPQEGAAPTWQGPTQEEWEEQQQNNLELMQILRGFQEQDGGQEYEPQFDPSQVQLDPFDDSFGSNLQQMMRAIVQEAISPISEQLGAVSAHTASQVNQEGEERARDIVADYARSQGVADPPPEMQEIALAMLPGVVAPFEQRYGQGARAVEMGLRDATDKLVAYGKAREEMAVNAYKASLGQHAGARGEMGTGSGAAVVGMPELDDEMAIARHFAGRSQ
jgi:hypothetical protein